jgi:hypothetical protein
MGRVGRGETEHEATGLACATGWGQGERTPRAPLGWWQIVEWPNSYPIRPLAICRMRKHPLHVLGQELVQRLPLTHRLKLWEPSPRHNLSSVIITDPVIIGRSDLNPVLLLGLRVPEIVHLESGMHRRYEVCYVVYRALTEEFSKSTHSPRRASVRTRSQPENNLC